MFELTGTACAENIAFMHELEDSGNIPNDFSGFWIRPYKGDSFVLEYNQDKSKTFKLFFSRVKTHQQP